MRSSVENQITMEIKCRRNCHKICCLNANFEIKLYTWWTCLWLGILCCGSNTIGCAFVCGNLIAIPRVIVISSLCVLIVVVGQECLHQGKEIRLSLCSLIVRIISTTSDIRATSSCWMLYSLFLVILFLILTLLSTWYIYVLLMSKYNIEIYIGWSEEWLK